MIVTNNNFQNCSYHFGFPENPSCTTSLL